MRVTAAIDKDTEATMPRPLDDRLDARDEISTQDWQYADDDDEATVVEEITEVMLRHAVPDEVLDAVVAAVNVMGLNESRNALFAALQNLFEFKPLPQKSYGRPFTRRAAARAKRWLRPNRGARRCRAAQMWYGYHRAGGVEQLEAHPPNED